ncbi:hypothetical protein ABIA35_002064 [Catenulispora sp. MAP12-49]
MQDRTFEGATAAEALARVPALRPRVAVCWT